jgi:thiamine kinase-like enzyme
VKDIDFVDIFGRVPLLRHLAPYDFEITPLAGLTNFNFRLLNAHHDFVLRIPGKQTCQSIDRKAEAFNLDRAVRIGLSPELLWKNDAGLSLTQCITSSRTMTEADFQDETLVSLLLDRLIRLHDSDLSFVGKTRLSALLTDYSRLIPAARHIELAAYFEKALGFCREYETIGQRIVPSHNDLVLENLLIDQNEELWMIDWEYSAMSSPYWDLATLCNAARLDTNSTREFLNRYNQQLFKLEFEQLRRYQYMLQVLTIAWLLVFSSEAIEDEITWLNQIDV